ncbi:MAG TPA: hypothetical protein VI318_25310 [Baekduia sp.]
MSAISGMQAASLMFDQAAAAIASPGAAPDADLAKQVTNLTMGSIAYDVNARVLQSQDETRRNVIDLVV